MSDVDSCTHTLKAAYSVLICFLYLLVGLALILLNKWILKDVHFPYPIFLSGLGVMASAIFAWTLVILGYVELVNKEAVAGKLWYQRVLPVGLAHAGTLSLGNMAYLLLDVGFIQMLKSFTPVIIIMVCYMANIDSPTIPVIYCVVVIAIGVAITTSFVPKFHLLGLFVMFLSQLTEAVRLVFTQFFLQKLKFGIVESQCVLAPASAFWLIVASVLFEFPAMYQFGAWRIFFDNIHLFVVASMMGVTVNFLAYMVIQAAGSLMVKMLGTVRSIFTISIGVVFFHEIFTVKEILGYGIALIGFIGYNLAKTGYLDDNRCLNQSPVVLLLPVLAKMGINIRSSRRWGSGGSIDDPKDMKDGDDSITEMENGKGFTGTGSTFGDSSPRRN
mmetsp:Transcript_5523/g.9054  ORF Transcript_5523/g.9054 Transcript_5523/m.9054 type:complete len:387 (+) Transcript_5523:214-1374(+)